MRALSLSCCVVVCALLVPYTFTYTIGNNSAYFNLSLYDTPYMCNDSTIFYVLTATSTTSQISCTPGTATYFENSTQTVSNVWYTIGTTGGGGGGGGGGNDDSKKSSFPILILIVAVVVVAAVIAVAALLYWRYRRSQAARGEALISGESSGYSTLA